MARQPNGNKRNGTPAPQQAPVKPMTLDEIALSLDASMALVSTMTAIGAADDTRAMSSVDIFRILTNAKAGGLTEAQIAELPQPGTQGWVRPVWDAKAEHLLNEAALYGVSDKGVVSYPGGFSDNPEYLRRQSEVQGSKAMVPYSRLEIFARALKVCRDWQAIIDQADKDREASALTQAEFDKIAARWEGKISRMVDRVVNGIKLGHQIAACENDVWSKVMRFRFAVSKVFERDKDGKFVRDNQGHPVFTLVDERTDKPVQILALDDDGVVVNRFDMTVEAFLALDFTYAATHDGSETPAGKLPTLFETAARSAKTDKDAVNVTNTKRAVNAFLSLAGWLPDGDRDVTKELDKGGDVTAELLDAMRTVARHANGYLNIQANKKLLNDWDGKVIAAKEKEIADRAAATEKKVAA